MKLVNKTTYFFLAFLTIILFFACKKDDKEITILRKWYLTSEITETKDLNLNKTSRDTFYSLYRTYYVQFNADSTVNYVTLSPSGSLYNNGTYKMTNNTIITKMSTHTDTFSILELTSSDLKLYNETYVSVLFEKKWTSFSK